MAYKKLSDETIIKGLLTHSTKQETAEYLGIAPQTISNKLRDAKFVQKYNEAKSEILQSVIVRLSGASNVALDLIIDSVTNEEIPISIRIQSAKDILRMNREYIEIDDLARRIALLENSVQD